MAGGAGEGAAELVAGYQRELAELTYNSKPIITSLTILADENKHASAAIAACICRHILQAAPAYKLPALYLLDSICKNLRGVDYVAHFRPQIVHVFTSAYLQVAPAQRQALKHLFRTWTDGRIFDLEALQSIDNELARIDAEAPPARTTSTPPSADPRRARPTSALPVALGHEIHVNPKLREGPFPRANADAALPLGGTLPAAPPLPPLPAVPLQPPVAPLRQYPEHGLAHEESLRRKRKGGGSKRRRGSRGGERDRGPPAREPPPWPLPGAGPPRQETEYPATPAIAQHAPLSEGPPPGYGPPLAAPVAVAPSPVSAPSAEAFQQAEQLLAALHSLLPTAAAPPAAPTPPLPPGPPPRPAPPLPPGFPPAPQASGTSTPPPPTVAPSPPPMDLQQLTLLSSLLAAQIQPPPPPGPAPPRPAAAPPASIAAPGPAVLDAEAGTEEVGRAFVAEELRVRREGVVAALYSAFPHQCKRCGRRFAERTEYSAHLDWHFQQNKRRRERKTASRPWFHPADDWGGSPEGGPGPDEREAGGGEEAAAAGVAEESAAVPADEAQSTCALCGEAFEVFWSAEEDEWMYRGASYLHDDADGAERGPIVHVKCRADRDALANGTADEATEHTEGESTDNGGATSSLREELGDLVALLEGAQGGGAVAKQWGGGEAGEARGALRVPKQEDGEAGTQLDEAQPGTEAGGPARAPEVKADPDAAEDGEPEAKRARRQDTHEGAV